MFEEVSEEVGVGVLAELVENKPVTKVAVGKNTTACGQVGVSETSVAEEKKEASEKIHLRLYLIKDCYPPDRRQENDHQPEYEVQDGQDSEAKQPEPQH